MPCRHHPLSAVGDGAARSSDPCLVERPLRESAAARSYGKWSFDGPGMSRRKKGADSVTEKRDEAIAL